ncbi:hypothetical protein PC9H_002306 [Pleurotus ostreatus]|uniref:C2H2-type domain-containing protein n=1 Tax=Pleurotus ostreatus TaxID=5322 RepID=A0A8H6ZLF6_PLEOS|nr:uncharacterized protein PC9H_002306 [Pleurotus ostreatus]KAF7419714.1 hypothetical protein PC9H_002306 [Pleurotus ostreatus]KAJ8689407.1 hypothetical protein PTI98_012312 [Pleurotus ostreatus]
MSSPALSQWSWLDPALRPASGGDATIPEREASPPNEPTGTDSPPTFNVEIIKLLPGVLHCEIVGGIDGAPRVAQIYTLPERLPCPWPPMGPFAPVRLEDLQMVEVPLDVNLDSKEIPAPDEGVKVVRLRAFEAQTKSFGAKPLSTMTNIATGVPVPSQDANQEQQKRVEECDSENDRDVLDVAALEATVSVPSGKRSGGRKRSINQVGGARDVPEGRTKIKRTYLSDGAATYCTLCGDLLETETDRRNHSSLCGTGRKHISCDLCGAPISRKDAVKRHQGYQICKDARAYYAQYGQYIRS